jgi:hypothetical protein
MRKPFTRQFGNSGDSSSRSFSSSSTSSDAQIAAYEGVLRDRSFDRNTKGEWELTVDGTAINLSANDYMDALQGPVATELEFLRELSLLEGACSLFLRASLRDS